MTSTDSSVTLADIIAAMGWRVDSEGYYLHQGVRNRWGVNDDEGEYAPGTGYEIRPWRRVFEPQTDIAAAEQVVEALTRLDRPGPRLYFKMTYRPGASWACFGREATAGAMIATKRDYACEAPTMTAAIYGAACRVVEGERER